VLAEEGLALCVPAKAALALEEFLEYRVRLVRIACRELPQRFRGGSGSRSRSVRASR
jgi:hypothetical protein